MTFEEFFLLKAVEKASLYKKCRHENLAIDCRVCEDEADKAAEEGTK